MHTFSGRYQSANQSGAARNMDVNVSWHDKDNTTKDVWMIGNSYLASELLAVIQAYECLSSWKCVAISYSNSNGGHFTLVVIHQSCIVTLWHQTDISNYDQLSYTEHIMSMSFSWFSHNFHAAPFPLFNLKPISCRRKLRYPKTPALVWRAHNFLSFPKF